MAKKEKSKVKPFYNDLDEALDSMEPNKVNSITFGRRVIIRECSNTAGMRDSGIIVSSQTADKDSSMGEILALDKTGELYKAGGRVGDFITYYTRNRMTYNFKNYEGPVDVVSELDCFIIIGVNEEIVKQRQSIS